MLLTRERLQRIVNGKVSTPFAQRNLLNTPRAMFKWALKEGRIPDDPALGVTREKVKTTGYKTFSVDHIARFEATHTIGTKGRLAFALLLYTGQRRGRYAGGISSIRSNTRPLEPSPRPTGASRPTQRNVVPSVQRARRNARVTRRPARGTSSSATK
jgi:hypothetical protein